MKYFIPNLSFQDIIQKFIETDDPIYVYNFLIRYFYINMKAEKNIFFKIDKHITYSDIQKMITQYSKKFDDYIVSDHTIFYILDIESNTELFRHFISNCDWKEWNNKTILEVGCGGGIYTFLFNELKTYFNVPNLQICSYDFSDYKISKILNIEKRCEWTNNIIKCVDCIEESFDDVNNDIVLIYSETFSMFGAHRENFYKIIDNIKFRLSLDNIFPYSFRINNTEEINVNDFHQCENSDIISHVFINNKFQNILTGFDIDKETEILKKYINENYSCFGFRWGFW